MNIVDEGAVKYARGRGGAAPPLPPPPPPPHQFSLCQYQTAVVVVVVGEGEGEFSDNYFAREINAPKSKRRAEKFIYLGKHSSRSRFVAAANRPPECQSLVVGHYRLIDYKWRKRYFIAAPLLPSFDSLFSCPIIFSLCTNPHDRLRLGAFFFRTKQT